MHSLDLPPNQLRTFLAVARRLSFTRAAEELHLTQPAVSMHIRKLERAIGATLFDHLGRRVSLMATGHVLYDSSDDRRPMNERPERLPSRASA